MAHWLPEPRNSWSLATIPDPKRIEAVFAAVLEKATAAERAAYLDEACGGDAAVRQRVEALFQAHEQAGSFLEKPALEAPTAAIVRPESPQQAAAEAPTLP